jgi:hypothetical protein
MSYQQRLSRIRRLFEAADARLAMIVKGLNNARLKVPVAPMTDHELARAIREFQAGPGSNDGEMALRPLRPQMKMKQGSALDGD